MPLQSSNQYGATYKWGFGDADAPTITGATIREAEIKYNPEVNSKATDGEGHTESVTVSKPTKRMHSGTFKGYTPSETALATTADFNWNNRFWIIGPITLGKKKGDYWEVTIEADSYANVSGPA